MKSPNAYIPIDRRHALAKGEILPSQTSGATVFADISGFTPLTTALMKELGPRRGPEELTRQLNLVYNALIAEVHQYGGSVIGFSGDAITCWFDGDDGRRAVTCGLALQEAMQQFTAIKTPSGNTVSLALKVAVSAGAVRRFLVGDPVIQYKDVMAGSTLERMADGEGYADKGEVIAGPQVIAQLGDLLEIADQRDEFAHVTGIKTTVELTPWPDEPTLTEIELRSWVLGPVYERLARGQDRFVAEIRPCTALFMKFDGIDYDNDEAAGEKLDAYIRWIQSLIVKYEGTLIQLTLGDKGSYLYTAFGAPIAHEDDPTRAVAMGYDLINPPPELDYMKLPQVGISRGHKRTGP